jgi:hypothetical protein
MRERGEQLHDADGDRAAETGHRTRHGAAVIVAGDRVSQAAPPVPCHLLLPKQ